jgi:pyrroloquinoline-quinone synthase
MITIFVEGSIKDRKEIASAVTPGQVDVNEKILEHPLVKYQGVNPVYMDLIRAHHSIEGSHRIAAWKMVLDHARTPAQQHKVRRAVAQSLKLWLAYRDGVARACKLER